MDSENMTPGSEQTTERKLGVQESKQKTSYYELRNKQAECKLKDLSNKHIIQERDMHYGQATVTELKLHDY
jgi:hypothetical protein